MAEKANESRRIKRRFDDMASDVSPLPLNSLMHESCVWQLEKTSRIANKAMRTVNFANSKADRAAHLTEGAHTKINMQMKVFAELQTKVDSHDKQLQERGTCIP